MTRLDTELARRGITFSRERAKREILFGNIRVNGMVVKKPAFEVLPEDKIECISSGPAYVSRGGLKLEKALEAFNIRLSGLNCLDIGASVGGFTDCMLQCGAKKVYAVDVGHGQLAQKLLDDPRVHSFEGVNVKNLTPEFFKDGDSIDFAASDISFISVKYAALALRDILPEDKSAVLLIKPQFEAGPQNISKNGIVRSPKAHIYVLNTLIPFFEVLGFTTAGLIPSPIKGGDGNTEYLIHIIKHKSFTSYLDDFDLKKFVQTALSEGR